MDETMLDQASVGGYYVITGEGHLAYAPDSIVVFLDENQVRYLEDTPMEYRNLIADTEELAIDAASLYQYMLAVEPVIPWYRKLTNSIWSFIRES